MKTDLGLSLLIHFALTGGVGAILFWSGQRLTEPDLRIPIVVVNSAPKIKALTPPPVVETSPDEPPPPPERRKVFGQSKKALTSDSSSAPQVKAGNTISKTPDQLKLEEDDLESLPIPQPEYLLTEMPKVLKQTKINYPQKAKELGLEGRVVLNVLVDETGRVRMAEVLEGLTSELDQEALRAIQLYEFSPGRIDQKAVAVRIQFAIQFILEEG